jgi:hypothetical protein
MAAYKLTNIFLQMQKNAQVNLMILVLKYI